MELLVKSALKSAKYKPEPKKSVLGLLMLHVHNRAMSAIQHSMPATGIFFLRGSEKLAKYCIYLKQRQAYLLQL